MPPSEEDAALPEARPPVLVLVRGSGALRLGRRPHPPRASPPRPQPLQRPRAEGDGRDEARRAERRRRRGRRGQAAAEGDEGGEPSADDAAEREGGERAPCEAAARQ